MRSQQIDGVLIGDGETGGEEEEGGGFLTSVTVPLHACTGSYGLSCVAERSVVACLLCSAEVR